MNCLRCDKEIDVRAGYKILALDKPYLNLTFHNECYPLDKSDKDKLVQKALDGTEIVQSQPKRLGNSKRTIR